MAEKIVVYGKQLGEPRMPEQLLMSKTKTKEELQANIEKAKTDIQGIDKVPSIHLGSAASQMECNRH